MKFIGLIPARYASTRFPGKPLAMLGGKPVIQRVYEQVSTVIDKVYVCTDDERIRKAVEEFGGKVVMTSTEHRSGTDRCYEAYSKVGEGYDVVINIQGDEPFIQPEQIQALMDCFPTEIATLVHPFSREDTWEDLQNPNYVKVAIAHTATDDSTTIGKALYFSRSVVPYMRGTDKDQWLNQGTYYRHIGMYAYRADILEKITSLSPTLLEKTECLEQLRWLENGLTIHVGLSHHASIGIDTPEDLQAAIQYLNSISL